LLPRNRGVAGETRNRAKIAKKIQVNTRPRLCKTRNATATVSDKANDDGDEKTK
jgi:hypothetical protein